jgi:hypothetical protein
LRVIEPLMDTVELFIGALELPLHFGQLRGIGCRRQ